MHAREELRVRAGVLSVRGRDKRDGRYTVRVIPGRRREHERCMRACGESKKLGLHAGDEHARVRDARASAGAGCE